MGLMTFYHRYSANITVGLICLLTITFISYSKDVDWPYILDDIPNLVDNQSLILNGLDFKSTTNAAMSSPSSIFYRPISMLTFAANFTFAGNKDPYSAKFTNILIHLFIGVGIFLLVFEIFPYFHLDDISNRPIRNRTLFSLSVCSFFLLHPFFVSAYFIPFSV